MVKFTWMMRNVLKRMKNQFSDFYFSSYDHFCTQNYSNFRYIFTITRKIKIGKIVKLIFHAHLSLKREQTWGEGALNILSWEIPYVYIHCTIGFIGFFIIQCTHARSIEMDEKCIFLCCNVSHPSNYWPTFLTLRGILQHKRHVYAGAYPRGGRSGWSPPPPWA